MNRNAQVENIFIGTQFAEEQRYWINKLSGDWEKSVFPCDYGKGAGNARKMATWSFQFPEELCSRVIRSMNGADSRLHIILMAGLVQLINKYLGIEDIIIGTPIDKQDMEGDFINTFLILRNPVIPEMTFKDLLFQVKQTLLEAYNNQNYPLDTLPYELNRKVDENEDFPLFDVAILLDNIHEKSYLSGINFNLLFSFCRTDNDVEGKVEYNELLYKEESIKRISGHFITLLREGLNNPAASLADLDILDEKEKNYLLVEINQTEAEVPGSGVVHERFQAQVERTPGNRAVEETDRNRSISYECLNRYADQLAGFLIKKGLKKGMIVAIIGARTADIIISILAVFKAGGIFLPLDGQNLDERIDFILRDSCAQFLLSQKNMIEEKRGAFLGIFPENIIAMDDERIYQGEAKDPQIELFPSDPAYIIYTSGTTGKPKGVMVSHDSLVNYTHFAIMNYINGEAVHFPFYTSIAFDLTLTSIMTPLLSGNAVVVYSDRDQGNIIEQIIDDGKVGVIKLTPSHLSLIREKKIGKKGTSVKRLIVGGENLESQLAQDISLNFNGDVEIYNEYGPTEATVGCMLYRFDPLEDIHQRRSVSIGGPAFNTRIYLLDKHLKPVPMGGIGEIYISGSSLAKGYLNQPELTSEKFKRNVISHLSLANGKRNVTNDKCPMTNDYFYKTGDLGRWLSDGNLEFLGRIDQQVKIRGYRIELGEIITRLSTHENVTEVEVVVCESPQREKYLCAYFVSKESVNTSDLRDYLARRLPGYMVPAYFVQLERMPLTPNGKLDRRALPEPGIQPGDNYIPPRNPTEERLVSIWQEILGVEHIGINHSFFQLGGNSLNVISLIAIIHRNFHIKPTVSEIFLNETVEKQAQLLETLQPNPFASIEPAPEKDAYAVSSVQRRLYFLQVVDPRNISYNIPMVFSLEGEYDPEKIETTFRQLIDRHESLRTSFHLNGEALTQIIHATGEVQFCIEYKDLGPSDSPQAMIGTFIRPFALSHPPLFRVGIIRLNTLQSIVVIDTHHIISDGISQAVFSREFMTLYNNEPLGPLRIQYKDFAEWLNTPEQISWIQKQEEYWLKRFEGELPLLQLPTDFNRPNTQLFAGDDFGFQLSPALSQSLNEVARKEGATLFMVLLALFNLTLSRLSGQEDIIIGTSLAGRRHSDLENIIGMFINALALRNYPSAHKTFREFLQEVRENTLEDFENQDFPFESLVDQVLVERVPG
ncbi:MAG: amino acid adenylation domain-containing protein, partial [Candidatus Omnitrophota bacterium]